MERKHVRCLTSSLSGEISHPPTEASDVQAWPGLAKGLKGSSAALGHYFCVPWAMSFVATKAANLNSSFSKTYVSLQLHGVAGCSCA